MQLQQFVLFYTCNIKLRETLLLAHCAHCHAFRIMYFSIVKTSIVDARKMGTFLSFNFLYLSVTFWCSMDTMVCKTLNTVKSSKSIEMREQSLYLSVAHNQDDRPCRPHIHNITRFPAGPIGVSAWPILAPGPYV